MAGVHVRASIVAVGTLLLVGCGGSNSSPAGPTPTVVQPTPTPPPTFTLSGMLTATNGGQPLTAAAVDFGGSTVMTDGAGRYSVTLPVSSPSMALTIHGDGLLAHVLQVDGQGAQLLVGLAQLVLRAPPFRPFPSLAQSPMHRWHQPGQPMF